MAQFLARWPFGKILAAGIMVLAATFVYGAVRVGVPYQDPTPDMLARWNADMRLVNRLFLVGLALVVAGLSGMIVRRFTKL